MMFHVDIRSISQQSHYWHKMMCDRWKANTLSSFRQFFCLKKLLLCGRYARKSKQFALIQTYRLENHQSTIAFYERKKSNFCRRGRWDWKIEILWLCLLAIYLLLQRQEGRKIDCVLVFSTFGDFVCLSDCTV